MMIVRSLQILQEQPLVLKKPFGREGISGLENGLLVRIEDRLGSFLLADIKDSLGRILEDRGHPLTIE